MCLIPIFSAVSFWLSFFWRCCLVFAFCYLVFSPLSIPAFATHSDPDSTLPAACSVTLPVARAACSARVNGLLSSATASGDASAFASVHAVSCLTADPPSFERRLRQCFHETVECSAGDARGVCVASARFRQWNLQQNPDGLPAGDPNLGCTTPTHPGDPTIRQCSTPGTITISYTTCSDRIFETTYPYAPYCALPAHDDSSAEQSADRAETAADEAERSAADADQSATSASASAGSAAGSKNQAAASASDADASADEAQAAESGAEAAEAAAEGSATEAEGSATDASGSATEAEASKSAAESAKVAAEAAKAAAESAKAAAAESSTQVTIQVGTVAGYWTDVYTWLQTILGLVDRAEDAADDAEDSADEAEASAAEADASATDAEASETAAAGSAADAEASATDAEASAVEADASATDAEASATAAAVAELDAANAARFTLELTGVANQKAADAEASAEAASDSAVEAEASAEDSTSAAGESETSAAEAEASAEAASDSADDATAEADRADRRAIFAQEKVAEARVVLQDTRTVRDEAEVSADDAEASATDADASADEAETAAGESTSAKVAAVAARVLAQTAATSAQQSAADTSAAQSLLPGIFQAIFSADVIPLLAAIKVNTRGTHVAGESMESLLTSVVDGNELTVKDTALFQIINSAIGGGKVSVIDDEQVSILDSIESVLNVMRIADAGCSYSDVVMNVSTGVVSGDEFTSGSGAPCAQMPGDMKRARVRLEQIAWIALKHSGKLGEITDILEDINGACAFSDSDYSVTGDEIIDDVIQSGADTVSNLCDKWKGDITRMLARASEHSSLLRRVLSENEDMAEVLASILVVEEDLQGVLGEGGSLDDFLGGFFCDPLLEPEVSCDEQHKTMNEIADEAHADAEAGHGLLETIGDTAEEHARFDRASAATGRLMKQAIIDAGIGLHSDTADRWLWEAQCFRVDTDDIICPADLRSVAEMSAVTSEQLWAWGQQNEYNFCGDERYIVAEFGCTAVGDVNEAMTSGNCTLTCPVSPEEGLLEDIKEGIADIEQPDDSEYQSEVKQALEDANDALDEVNDHLGDIADNTSAGQDNSDILEGIQEASQANTDALGELSDAVGDLSDDLSDLGDIKEQGEDMQDYINTDDPGPSDSELDSIGGLVSAVDVSGGFSDAVTGASGFSGVSRSCPVLSDAQLSNFNLSFSAFNTLYCGFLLSIRALLYAFAAVTGGFIFFRTV